MTQPAAALAQDSVFSAYMSAMPELAYTLP